MVAALLATGTPPKEISALINQPVVEEHAGEAAFLWRLRERAIQAPHYSLKQLALLDARVLAHLAGLCTAGTAGLELAQRGLGELDGGTLFVAAYLAFSSGERDRMREAIVIALSSPQLMDSLVAALAWQNLDALQSVLALLGRSPDPLHRRICLATYAAHRANPGPLLERAIDDPDPALRARALRAVGELGRADLVQGLDRRLSDPDLHSRFWAAWSLALSGKSYAAQIAYEIAADDPVLCRTSLEIAMRAGEPAWARQLIRSLAGRGTKLRQAVLAAGSFGDPTVIPWLLEFASDEQLGRVAAEALALITGLDPELAAMKQDAPEELEDSHPEDDQLRWPNPDGLRSWWRAEHTRFTPGQRYLAGLPVSESAAFQVLRTGYQRQRRAAALELARSHQGAALFPIAARADLQRQRLSL